MATDRTSDRTLLGVSALLFVASAMLTIAWCRSMALSNGMPMCGGWSMSMAWMRMPDQTWLEAAAAFLGMWSVMMMAMMLPVLVPMLMHYRRSIAGTGAIPSGCLAALAGAGYFLVWIAVGMAVFPLGIALAEVQMQQPALARVVPLAGGVVVLLAGALQFSGWKTRLLACCRGRPAPTRVGSADWVTALRHGLRYGVRCACCCGNLMAILLVVGVMDLSAMAGVTAAVAAERLAPSGRRVARAIGGIAIAAGTLLIERAVQA